MEFKQIWGYNNLQIYLMKSSYTDFQKHLKKEAEKKHKRIFIGPLVKNLRSECNCLSSINNCFNAQFILLKSIFL